MIKKTISGIFSLLFLSFALLQLNDPDGPAWVLIYGGVAVINLLSFFGLYRRSIVWGAVLALFIFDLTLTPHFYQYLLEPDKSEIFGEMVYEKPYIEGTREFLGVLITIMALIVLARVFKSSS